MAKRDKDVLEALRASGLRKKVANALAESTGRSRKGKSSNFITESADRLKQAAAILERRGEGARRSEGAKKAARTRKRNAAKRSAAAKKGARTRSRSK